MNIYEKNMCLQYLFFYIILLHTDWMKTVLYIITPINLNTHINLSDITYLASACKKMGMLSALAEEPMTQTTSPYSCIMWSISRVTEGVQSVNSDTNSGTLSICSRWGRILSIPRGNFAWNHHLHDWQTLLTHLHKNVSRSKLFLLLV